MKPTKLAGFVVGAIAIAHVAYYFPRVVDDLFISLRYAENVAHARGIVLNTGEHVEGYSSPLWMLLQAVGFVFRFDGVTWTKLLGLASLGATLVGVQRYAVERLAVRPLAALLASGFLALNSYLIAWSVLGLETPIYLALLVWYPIVLRRCLDGETRRRRWLAGAVTVALACARPEAPLFVGMIGLAELVTPGTSTLRARLSAALRLAVPVGLVLVALLLARRAYFGLWLPHTYYVKGATSGWELGKLGPLFREGVPTLERVFYAMGILLAVALVIVQRAPTLLVAIGCALFFTASVERDWMPSLRHLLPVSVFAAIAWAWAIDRCESSERLRGASALIAGAMTFVLMLAGYQVAQIDMRLSQIDKGDRPWIKPKTRDKWDDAWLGLRRIEPPHVSAFGTYQMGLVTQNYRILEASAAPVEDSWYIGRDIGKVGFYTDVRVFDTPGLFTPAVVQSESWRTEHHVDGAIVRAAFAHKPVAAELLDAWTGASAAQPELIADYDVVVGSLSDPIDLVQKTGPHPAPAEVLRRYEASLAKFPSWYDLATLYGESVGAAMRKRVRVVRAKVEDEAKPEGVAVREHGAGARLGGALESRGCELGAATARRGSEVKVSCSWLVLATPPVTYWTFLHFDDAQGVLAFHDDHPAGAFRPTIEWKPGEVVRDVSYVFVPANVAPGTYKLLFGMFKDNGRPSVTPSDMTDGKDRIFAGTLQVVP